MNRTNFEHAFYAVVIQSVIALITGDWLAGAMAGSYFFIGREHSQREEIISPHDRSNPFPAFKVWEWELDEILDMVFPIVATSLVTIIATYLI